jgi:hypothetical protein
MDNVPDVAVDRPGLVTRLGIAVLAMLAALLLAVVAEASPASAVCGNDCTDVVDYYATVSVARPPRGQVTSDEVVADYSGDANLFASRVQVHVDPRPTTR